MLTVLGVNHLQPAWPLHYMLIKPPFQTLQLHCNYGGPYTSTASLLMHSKHKDKEEKTLLKASET